MRDRKHEAPLTDRELDIIRENLARTCPRPLSAMDNGVYEAVPDNLGNISLVPFARGKGRDGAVRAAFMAQAPDTIRLLLAELDRLARENG